MLFILLIQFDFSLVSLDNIFSSCDSSPMHPVGTRSLEIEHFAPGVFPDEFSDIHEKTASY